MQAAAVPSGSSVIDFSVLARNRTWTSTFAGLHAHPAHPEDVIVLAARRGVEPRLAVSKTAVRIRHTRRLRDESVSRPGIEPGLRPSEGRVQSATPSGHKHEREESNPVEQFWRLPALPGAHSCTLLFREEQPGYPKGVEPLPPGSQPGMQRPLHHGHHVNQQLDQDLNPGLCVRTAA